MSKKKKIEIPRATVPQRPGGKASYLADLFASKYYVFYYAIFIFLLTIVLFNEFVFSSKMLFSSDGINASLYFRKFFKDYFLQHWGVPMWSPYIFGGMPFVDAFHSDIFYPLTLPFKLLLPIPIAFGWAMLFHVFLAGLCMYLCVRGFGLSKLSASLAGVFYMFAPYLVSLVQPGHDGKMYVTALFPLTILFLERGMNRGKFLDFVLLGASVGLIILTPHPQMSYFSLWAIGFYFGFRLITRLIEEKKIQGLIKPAAFFVFAIVLGLAVSAIQFFPAYRYVKEFSPRAEDEAANAQSEQERYQYATSWSMNMEELVSQFIPNFCGTNARKVTSSGETAPTYWGRNAFKDNSEYIGILPIFFGLLGIIFARNKRIWFFLGLALFALIYALGATTPFFRIFYELIPNVKHLRAPSMIMFLFSFSFCLMAAYGIDYLQHGFTSEKPERKKKVLWFTGMVAATYIFLAFLFAAAGRTLLDLFKSLFYSSLPEALLQQRAYPNLSDVTIGLLILAGLLVLVFLIVRGLSRQRLGLWALAIIMFLGIIDVWRMDLKFITTDDPQLYFSEKNIVRKLKSFGKPYVDRILNCDRGVLRSSNYFAYQGVPEMFGYHGNQMKQYDEYWGRVGKSNDHSFIYQIYLNARDDKDPRNGQITWLNIPFMSMAGVRYVVCDYATNPGDYQSSLRLVSPYSDVQADGLALYENLQGFQRCRLFHDYIVMADHDSALALLRLMKHDWTSQVVLEKNPGVSSHAPIDTIGEKAEIISYEPNKIRIQATLKSDGILYLADCYYPAWKAYVDGKKTEVLLANVTFRAIPLAAGKHSVEFVYESEIYSRSRVITYASLIFIVLAVAFNLNLLKPKRKVPVE